MTVILVSYLNRWRFFKNYDFRLPTLEDLRNLSAAVYAIILLVIGIPLWWRMTEVQRHPLPYTQISQLGSMDVIIATDIFVYTENPSETENIIDRIHTAFNSSNSL